LRLITVARNAASSEKRGGIRGAAAGQQISRARSLRENLVRQSHAAFRHRGRAAPDFRSALTNLRINRSRIDRSYSTFVNCGATRPSAKKTDALVRPTQGLEGHIGAEVSRAAGCRGGMGVWLLAFGFLLVWLGKARVRRGAL
jgi:hypothetical protein